MKRETSRFPAVLVGVTPGGSVIRGSLARSLEPKRTRPGHVSVQQESPPKKTRPLERRVVAGKASSRVEAEGMDHLNWFSVRGNIWFGTQ